MTKVNKNGIRVGDKVRILANPDVFADEIGGSFRHFKAKDLIDQLGTVVPVQSVTVKDDETGVELDNSKIIIRKRFLITR